MGRRGRVLIEDHFTFEGQSRLYEQLFDELAHHDQGPSLVRPAVLSTDR